MGNRTFMKFQNNCQITKTIRKRKTIETTMKCPNISKKPIRVIFAQDILDSI